MKRYIATLAVLAVSAPAVAADSTSLEARSLEALKMPAPKMTNAQVMQQLEGSVTENIGLTEFRVQSGMLLKRQHGYSPYTGYIDSGWVMLGTAGRLINYSTASGSEKYFSTLQGVQTKITTTGGYVCDAACQFSGNPQNATYYPGSTTEQFYPWR